MFSHPFPNAFGIDISDLSVKVVQLQNLSHRRQGASYELKEYRSIELPPGLIVNGDIQEPEKVQKYIKHLLNGKNKDEKPIRSRWCIAALPEPQSFIKLISIPKKRDNIIENDIIDSAKKHVPFNEEDSFFDWQIITPLEKHQPEITNVLVAATPKHIARDYTYLLESLGLGVIALEIEALAIARAMVTANKDYEGEARVILDLGATHSSLIIYDKQIVQFSIGIPFSGELIVTALSQRLTISRPEAEEKKKHVGLFYDQKDRQGKQAWRIIADLTNELLIDMEKAIQFYYSHFPDANQIKKIILAGGGSNIKRLDSIISHKLHIPCARGNPWKNLAHRKKIGVKHTTALGYATAIGLALRAADNPFFKSDVI